MGIYEDVTQTMVLLTIGLPHQLDQAEVRKTAKTNYLLHIAAIYNFCHTVR